MREKLHLSKYELWFLFSLVAPAGIVGFRNPVSGMLTEDMFPLAQEASFSLLDKGLIYVDAGKITIEDGVEQLIRGLAKPDLSILVGSKVSNAPNEIVRSFNFDRGRIILLEELVDRTYVISNLDTKEEMLDIFTEPFVGKIFWAPDNTNPILVTEEKIVELQNLISAFANADEIQNILKNIEGDEQSKNHFLATLQNPILRCSCLGFTNRNDPRTNDVQGFSFIAGERYIWLLELVDEGEKNVRISKSTLKDINKKFNAMLP
jgi:hypothetical protein